MLRRRPLPAEKEAWQRELTTRPLQVARGGGEVRSGGAQLKRMALQRRMAGMGCAADWDRRERRGGALGIKGGAGAPGEGSFGAVSIVVREAGGSRRWKRS